MRRELREDRRLTSMNEVTRQRVLIGKVGLDGHDRGAKVVAMMLRDAGYEVIYTGLRQTPETIAAAAVDEDVDLLGLSVLSGAHGLLVPAVIDELRKRDADDIPVVVGGIIPEEDRGALEAAGVVAIFGPGDGRAEILARMRTVLAQAST
jgi:methylmalonyl-CoA mutase C-terminal domain/subunit